MIRSIFTALCSACLDLETRPNGRHKPSEKSFRRWPTNFSYSYVTSSFPKYTSSRERSVRGSGASIYREERRVLKSARQADHISARDDVELMQCDSPLPHSLPCLSRLISSRAGICTVSFNAVSVQRFSGRRRYSRPILPWAAWPVLSSTSHWPATRPRPGRRAGIRLSTSRPACLRFHL